MIIIALSMPVLIMCWKLYNNYYYVLLLNYQLTVLYSYICMYNYYTNKQTLQDTLDNYNMYS